ncbi:uncharacterized protein LOC123004213 [Tribolium madens]|uniref:uncharacterized protein LOC123004213 n=1 Tax=Tribolium madens TaxID=41895 RepID=UPI001CF74E8A|nr:uncharacterized protein LOC123004213 [Tribolium madens]
MDENSQNSVYNLITNLCETFSYDQTVVKKLRSKAYEILLKKTSHNSTSQRHFKGLDPYSNLLAWQFTLATKYNLVEHSLKLKECGEYVQNYYDEHIIQFLLCLRNVPVEKDDSVDFELPFDIKSLYKMPSTSKSDCSDTLIDIADSCSSADVWAEASKLTFSNRKNWEDFGHSEPDKEKPFLCELGELSHLWVENLPSVYFSCVLQDDITVEPLL